MYKVLNFLIILETWEEKWDNISKSSIFQWFIINNNKINYPWVDDYLKTNKYNL